MDRRALLLSTAAFIGSRALAAQDPVTVGIMGGEIDGTFMRVAADLTSVLNSDTLRVIPIVGKGSLQNLGDLINLKGVDLALVASDVLDYAHKNNLYPGKLQRVEYICKLYDNDVHVIAGPDIKEIKDLHGKPVNIDVEGSGTNLTMRAIFKAFNVAPDFRTDEPGTAMTKLQHGQVAAVAYVVGKPARLFQLLTDTKYHFLPINYQDSFGDTYLPGGQLTHADYPIIPEDAPVTTVGVGVTMAVFGWAANTERYNNLVRFTDTFFTKFNELTKLPHHPKWREVNIYAQQPGWTRFQPATAWLTSHSIRDHDNPEKQRFVAYMKQHGIDISPSQSDEMFHYFSTEHHGKVP